MENEKDYEHPSYGALTLHRVNGRRRLFGSDLDDNSFVALSVHESTMRRNLLTSWHHPGREIIEVGFSHHQFGRLLSSMSMGEGIPCTILRRDGQLIPEPPDLKDLDLTMEEAKSELSALEKQISEKVAEIEAIFDRKGAPRKAEKEAILGAFKMLARVVGSKFDFMIGQIEASGERLRDQALSSAAHMLERELSAHGLSLEDRSVRQIENKVK